MTLPDFVQRDAPLTALNTFGLPAQAALFAVIETPAQLATLIALPEWSEWPRLILGGGSNLILTGDVAGLTLQVRILGRELIAEDSDAWQVRAGAGEGLAWLVQWTTGAAGGPESGADSGRVRRGASTKHRCLWPGSR